MWAEFKALCPGIQLTEIEDKCFWTLSKSGKFTVRSLYSNLKTEHVLWRHSKMWEARIPLIIEGDH